MYVQERKSYRNGYRLFETSRILIDEEHDTNRKFILVFFSKIWLLFMWRFRTHQYLLQTSHSNPKVFYIWQRHQRLIKLQLYYPNEEHY